jgi:predicted DsbA family dithiol-disulfide isomerase
LDLKKFEKDMKDPALQKAVEDDANFARSNGAGGTPSFFINGVLLVGAQPYEKFKEVIDALLAENK